MLKLVQIEFFKLRRKKFIWIMLLSALVMPFLAFLLFKFVKDTGGNPAEFYRWSAFSMSTLLILPVVLGVLCTMLMYNENQYDMLKQLWIVPVSKMGYFFSKFFVVFIYAICFMLIEFLASVLFSVVPGIIPFEWGSISYLLKKCIEIGILMPFVMLPILAIAASQKSYILPISLTLVYTLFGFMIMSVNEYLLPLCSMFVIIDRNLDVPGVFFAHTINVPLAFLCILIWDIAAVFFANLKLGRRK